MREVKKIFKIKIIKIRVYNKYKLGGKMKIVAWNCLGNFDTKIDEIKKLNADIYVISECEDPSNYDYQKDEDFACKHYWVGDNNYGLGIFAKEDVELELVNLDNKGLKYFLPVQVNDDFNLLGVWTKIDKGESNAEYPKLITKYYEEHKDSGFFNEDMIMCGDFNCDKRLKNPTHGENVDEMMDKLSEIQLVDVYHDIYNENQGEESKATFYLYKHLDKPYHLDHVFAAKGKVKCLQVEKDVDRWVNPKKSDHVPIIFEIK